MALSVGDRARVYRAVMRFWSNEKEGVAVTKTQLQAAVNAADDWVEANSAAYNAALPTAFRNNATVNQKALLLAIVVLARFLPDFVRRALGVEID